MLTLFTPATGFPDLEAKIAYGLVRIGIEAGYECSLLPQKGFYLVKYKGELKGDLNKSFYLILNRLLSLDRFFDLGVKAKDKGKYSAKPEVIKDVIKQISEVSLEKVFSLEKRKQNINIKKNTFCAHDEFPRFGGRTGLILLSSFHAGKPYERDKRFVTFNQSLCSICGYLAVLGFYSFCFKIEMGAGKNRKYVIVLPVPEKELNHQDILNLFSLQKTLYNFWLSDLQPLRTFSMGLLAKSPSLCDVVSKLELGFHLTLVSKDNRGDTVVEQTAFVNGLPFSKFISSSPYNTVSIEKLLGNYKNPPKISALIELNNIIELKQKAGLSKFARLYIHETSTENFTNFLYPETTKYLLREVAMIRPEIIEDPAVASLARTLRYFIRERKYMYADNIRNARKDSKDLEETIAKMLREGRLRYEQGEKIHLPSEADTKEIFRLANEDYEGVKTALIMIAFSFPSGIEEN